MKDYDYKCPSCSEVLNEADEVKFLTRMQDGTEGELKLAHKVGTYSYIHTPEYKFEKGELIDFFCPHCKFNLKSPKHADFVEIEMHVNNLIHFEVLFSRRYGVRRTYIVNENFTERHGDDMPGFDELF
jgi:hypothetical protein